MKVRMAVIPLLVGGWFAVGGVSATLASCPGGAEARYGHDGTAYCAPLASGTRADGVAGVADAVPAGPLTVAALSPAALGPGYEVTDEWVGGEVFYAVLAERVGERVTELDASGSGGPQAPVAVLQMVQRLPSDAAAADFFPIVAAAPPSDLPVAAQAAFGVEELSAAQQAADEVRAVARVLTPEGYGAPPFKGWVAVARKNAYIVSVEIRTRHDGADAGAGPRLDDLLRTLLLRLPAA